MCTLNSLLLLGVAFAWGFSGSALCWLLSQQKTFTVFTVQQQNMKAQATLESHSMQTRWESNAADCARVGESSRPSGQAEIQEHAALYLQSHSSGENRPRIPQPECEQHSRYFCSAANNPGPSTVQTGEPVGWHHPSLFAGVSGFSCSAAQGQGVGIVPCGSALAHTQRLGRAPGTRSRDVVGWSRQCISPSDRTVLPSVGAGPPGRALQDVQGLILLPSTSEKIFHVFHSPEALRIYNYTVFIMMTSF